MAVTDEQFLALTRRMERRELYEASHDAKIDAYWAAQFKLNDEIRKDSKSFSVRLTALEKRVVYLSALAAAVGAFLSGVVPSIWP